MNIVIICNSYPTEKNPHHQIFIKNMKENLGEQDKITVDVCYNRVFDFWKGADKNKDIFSNLVKYTVFIFSIIYFFVKRRKKIDLLFPQAVVFPTVFASVFKKLLNIPMVCYVHGGDVNLYPNASAIYKYMMEYALRSSDAVFVNSKDLYQKVHNISEHTEIQIISPGVDTTVMKDLCAKTQLREKYKLPQDKRLLLTAGDAIKRKGYDIFLQALLHLQNSTLEKIFVLLITEGPERKNLENFIDAHGLKNKVRITDKVNQRKLNEYYNTADIFIFPSREEPLGLVGLEAMATGLPVIAARVGGIPDYVKHRFNGSLFEPENATDLATKISEFITDSDLYEEICENTHIYPQKYSITEAAKKMKSIFLTISNK